MQLLTIATFARLAFAALIFLSVPIGALAEPASPYRGLWIGQITLNFANEVTSPLDTNNFPAPTDPKITTPTFDQANLRLLLHVDGAGNVSLLKDVAILNRQGGTNFLQSESDMALVTDERLYGSFPAQPAIRHASAVFDFGDGKATEALNAVVDQAAGAAAPSVATNLSDNFGTIAGRLNAQTKATLLAKPASAKIVSNADVAAAFHGFLLTNFNSTVLANIAKAQNPMEAAQAALTAATNLQTKSFFADARGIDVVHAVLAAVQRATTNGTDRTNAANNAAASFADINNDFNRFLAGKHFGDMITAAAKVAAETATATNAVATAITIGNAVRLNSSVNDLRTEALQLKVSLYGYTDTRGTNAIDEVLSAIINSAVASMTNTPGSLAATQSAAEQAGRGTLATTVTRYAIATEAPTLDYNTFINSDGFKNSSETAARAAAAGAVFARSIDPLFTQSSLLNAAKLAAIKALGDVYAAAARAVRTELPLVGMFGPGKGDSRFTWDIKKTNGTALASAALAGTIILPANHPTNPFRHRRHADNTVGFDITRKIRLDFDAASTGPLPRAGFGVDRVTGIYREEIIGLHKPLGPQKDTGLKVEGIFQLNRISLIDTLNAR